MKKRYIVLSGLLAVTLAACSQEKPKNEENTQKTEQTSQPEGTVGSKSQASSQKKAEVVNKGDYYSIQGKYDEIVIANKHYPLSKDYNPGENPYFVKELETGYVVIGDHQYFKGYTLFLAKDHVTELHHMETSVKLRFLEEMSLVQEAVAKAFEAEKMNIELLGNGDAHAHWHLFPRRIGDMKGHGLNGRGPVWWVPWEEMAAEDCQVKSHELEQMIKALSDELEKHLV